MCFGVGSFGCGSGRVRSVRLTVSVSLSSCGFRVLGAVLGCSCCFLPVPWADIGCALVLFVFVVWERVGRGWFPCGCSR